MFSSLSLHFSLRDYGPPFRSREEASFSRCARCLAYFWLFIVHKVQLRVLKNLGVPLTRNDFSDA